MNCTKFLILLGCNLAIYCSTHAQVNRRDSIIPDQTIEIRQVYKPEIAKPVKPVITPTLPRIDTSKPRFEYVVPQQTLTYTYHSVPIRPLALGKQDFVYPFQNYVKAGLGNLSSVYVDAGVGSVRNEDYETDFHFSHLSQRKEVRKQRYSNTTVDASGKYFLQDHALGAKVGFLHSGYSYYGYNPELYQYGMNAIRQNFTGGRITLSGENTTANIFNINYKPELSYSMYGDSYTAREGSFGFNLPASYTLDSIFHFYLGLKGSLTTLKHNNLGQKNNFLQINPAVDISLRNVQLHLGLSPTVAKGNEFYVLPDLAFRSELFVNSFALVAGWKGDLIQNTFEQLSHKNPFMHNDYTVKHTKTDQVYAGFETKIGNHLSFGATASWRQWKNMALFVNDYTLNPDGKKFAVVYDAKVQSLGLDAYFRYQIAQVISLSLNSSWNNFYQTSTYNRVWHEPQVKLGAAFETRPVKDLYLTATLDYWDRMFALQADGTSAKLPAFLDFGMQAEYVIVPRVSVFLQLNNIFNSRYERWQQYENFGFNIIGGLRFKF